MSEALALAARINASLDQPYAWRITRDRGKELGSSFPSSVGVEGPSTAPDEYLDKVRAGEGTRFRILDQGDVDEVHYDHPDAVEEGHELYGVMYEGYLYDPEGSWPMAPLDDYGQPNDGCTGIQHFNETTQTWDWI